jgi:hypothetical protein
MARHQVPAGFDSELQAIEREMLRDPEEVNLEFEIRCYEALLNVSSINLAREVKTIGEWPNLNL